MRDKDTPILTLATTPITRVRGYLLLFVVCIISQTRSLAHGLSSSDMVIIKQNGDHQTAVSTQRKQQLDDGTDQDHRHLQRTVENTLYNCSKACLDTEFCGSDFNCHSFSCENVYQFGPPEYTTGSESGVTSIENLKCYDIEDPLIEEDLEYLALGGSACSRNGNGSLPLVVSFNSEATNPCSNDIQSDIAVRMNRKCVARPSSSVGFVCYDISPTTNLEEYFATYAAKTLLDENVTDGANTTNRYWYTSNLQAYIKYTRPSDSQTVQEFLDYFGDKSSVSFNASLASAVSVHAFSFELFPTSETVFCDPGCKASSQFCGRDLKCYDYGCENFYKFGLKDVGKGDLTCVTSISEISTTECNGGNTEPKWPDAIRYRCSGFATFLLEKESYGLCSGWSGIDTPPVYTAPMNRYCYAKASAKTSFNCYDIAPGTNITQHFQKYFASVAAKPTCRDGFHEVTGCSAVTGSSLSGIYDCRLDTSSSFTQYLEVDSTSLQYVMHAALKSNSNVPPGLMVVSIILWSSIISLFLML